MNLDFLVTEPALIVGIATVLGVGFAIFQGSVAMKHEKKAKNLEAVTTLLHDFQALIGSEPSLKTKEECELYAVRFLDLVGTIAYLELSKQLPKSLTNVFVGYFKYALTLRNWYSTNIDLHEDVDVTWNHLEKWHKKYPEIEAYGDHSLGRKLRQYNALPDDTPQ